MSGLLEFYNSSINALHEMNLSVVPSSVYESAFHGFTPYLILLVVIAVIVYIKTQNIGIIGVIVGSIGSLFIYFGKLPGQLQIIPYVIIAISFAITLFLMFTERDYS